MYNNCMTKEIFLQTLAIVVAIFMMGWVMGGEIAEIRTEVAGNTAAITEMRGEMRANNEAIAEMRGAVRANTAAIAELRGLLLVHINGHSHAPKVITESEEGVQ